MEVITGTAACYHRVHSAYERQPPLHHHHVVPERPQKKRAKPRTRSGPLRPSSRCSKSQESEPPTQGRTGQKGLWCEAALIHALLGF